MPWETARGVEFALRLEASDYRAFTVAARKRLLWVVAGLIVVAFGAVAYLVVTMGSVAFASRGTSLLLTAAVLAVFYLTYVVAFVPNRMAAASDREPSMVMRVGDDGLSIVSTRGEWTYAWSDVVKLVETPEHFFVFVSARAALILPKRDIQHQAVLARLRARVPRPGRP